MRTNLGMSVVVILLVTLQLASASNQCYTCESGAYEKWQHTTCPVDGSINGWAVDSTVTCDGPCVTVLQTFSFANVARACSTQFYYGEDYTVPTDFSVDYLPNTTIGDNWYVFCDGDECNDYDMTDEQCDLIPECPVLEPPYDCFVCESGTGNSVNCPIDGTMAGWVLDSKVSCDNPCVTTLQRWPLGGVSRVCGTDPYLGGIDVPTSGNMTYNNNEYYFCEGDECNNQDMTEDLATFVALHGGKK